jgi:hypothetical protein
MPIDLRPGSPYLNQGVCTCPDGGGWQGMSPECCAAAPAETPSEGDAGGGSSSGGAPVETTTAAPVEDDDDDEKTVVVTETEEPNWLDRDSFVDDVSNKWIAGGSAVVCLVLMCLCMICLLLVIR